MRVPYFIASGILARSWLWPLINAMGLRLVAKRDYVYGVDADGNRILINPDARPSFSIERAV